MGIYLNPKNNRFFDTVNLPDYVDKTGMIEDLNAMIGKPEPMVCVSRPRRFGKTTAASMLAAYYGKCYDTERLFGRYEISRAESFRQYLNKFDILWIDMQDLLGRAMAAVEYGGETIPFRYMQKLIIREFCEEYPDIVSEEDFFLPDVIQRISNKKKKKFVVLIDEWDAVFRNEKENLKLQEQYINLLRGLFKGSAAESCIALAYMTGIFPVKKYGTQSALNNFKEFTMLEPKWMASYMGFTESEVRELCRIHSMDFAEMQRWYDGYRLEGAGHIYSPRSVTEAISNKKFSSYWTQTETFSSLKEYISMNFDGLKEAVVSMLGGLSCEVDPGTFQNDMVSFESRDDVLTFLVHLGYLAYDHETGRAFIPNEEVRAEFVRTVKHGTWGVAKSLAASSRLLESTLEKDEEAVAAAVNEAHMETASIWNYNNENSLRCTIMIAYYSARDCYEIVQEFPTGKGFADIVFLPLKNRNLPALVVELKWDQSAETAIAQIKDRRYGKALEKYAGKILLVGISYDKETKKHECMIEEWEKD